jgi:hypothetical protein
MILAPQFKEDIRAVTEIDKKYKGNWLKLIKMELFLYYPCLRVVFFIWYLRCMLDMLSQVLSDKIVDVGKLYGVLIYADV